MKYRLEVTKEYDIENNGYIDAIMDFLEILKKGTYDLKVKCLFKKEKGEEKEDSDMDLFGVVGQSEQLVCDHQWKGRFSEKRGGWRLCAKCSKEEQQKNE